jgi:hypothetical protein
MPSTVMPTMPTVRILSEAVAIITVTTDTFSPELDASKGDAPCRRAKRISLMTLAEPAHLSPEEFQRPACFAEGKESDWAFLRIDSSRSFVPTPNNDFFGESAELQPPSNNTTPTATAVVKQVRQYRFLAMVRKMFVPVD